MTEPDAGRAGELRAFISRLTTVLSTVLQNLQVSLQRLDGSTERVPLLGAAQKSDVTDDEVRRAAEAIVVEARLKTHDSQSLKAERARPETVREWMAALASGQFAVASASAMGALASKVALVGMVAGIVGFSAYNGGAPGLLERARSVELSLIAQSGDSEVARAIPEAPGTEPECAQPADCADDATTEAQVRAAYRIAAATALQRGIAGGGRLIVDVRSSAFRLGAVDARRAILQNSSRPAAPSLDPGAETSGYRPATHEAVPGRTADPIDEAFDRRVRSLRSNTRAWDRLRAWAAHPATPDYAAEAWLRTAVGDMHGPQLHQAQLWSEQSSTKFTRTLAETGDVDKARRSVHVPGDPDLHVVGTSRDARLFRDFSADATERVNTRVSNYDSGLEDPGSLRRSPMGARAPTTASLYDRLFSPTGAGADIHSPGSIGGRPGEGRPPAGPKPGVTPRASPVSARSFGSIRFSARVGGVVFGRPPDGIGTPPAVKSIRGEIMPSGLMQLNVGLVDGSRIALGPYHPAIIQHALAYVADGRVVVSTLPMPFRDEGQRLDVPARRVAVHPAFEDTAFACSAIQIDRFVDTFTMADDAPSGSALARIREGREAVTALGMLLSPEGPAAEAADRENYLKVVSEYSRVCNDDAQCFPLKHYSDMGIDFGRATTLLQCLHRAESPETRSTCWDTFSILPAPNYFMVDSGVREQPYVVDPGLNYASGRDKSAGALWPIEFMVQAVPLSSDDEDLAGRIGEGRDPWQFPKLSAEIQRQISTQISTNKGAREVYKNMRDFIALQRLFRTGLDGELGSEFPLDDLVKLSAQTRPFIRVERNEKWNISNALVQFLRQMEELAEDSMKEALPTLSGPCHDAVKAALSSDRGEFMPFRKGFWHFMASVDVTCAREQELATVHGVQSFLRQQELIDEMLAFESNSRPRTPLACPAL